MTKAYNPILATLGYVLSPDGAKVLMIHRNARADDAHFGKYNGLGGKLEAGENVVGGMKREIFEEAGIVCEDLELRGTISWPGFGKNGEDWFGFIFVITRWTGSLLTSNPEGSLAWIELSKVLDLELWEGDRLFLPMVFDRGIGQFHGVMPYHAGKPSSWSYSLL
jgi:8-oxo-dGTP diphosphatase